MSIRKLQRDNFITIHGWGAAQITALPVDLSFRRYFRLVDGKRRALLMDSPPDKENIRPYVKMDRHLASMEFSVPTIMELNEDAGFAIIEDFGDDTFTNLLANGTDQWTLYELAIDTLAALQTNKNAAQVELPAYNTELLMLEVMRFTEWFYPYYPQEKTIDPQTHARIQQEFEDAWQEVILALPAYQPNIVLRDYHVDNLMVLKDREGLAKCGILDFQDALLGHPAYDLASLLEDARRDIPEDLRIAMRARYTDLMDDISGENFNLWYDVLSAQRHAKILAHFNRFHLRDNNDSKLIHIPRVMGLLQRKLDRPVLGPVKMWFEQYMT